MSSKSRRKRKRSATGAAPRRPAAAPVRRPQAPADERPPAPWGSFPLVEVCVLAGIVLAVAGLVMGGERGLTFLGTGLLLASVGGLELSLREHFGGYRSHSALLAAVPAVVVLGVLFYTAPPSLPPLARLGIAAAVFGLAFWALQAAFRRRAGVAIKLR